MYRNLFNLPVQTKHPYPQAAFCCNKIINPRFWREKRTYLPRDFSTRALIAHTQSNVNRRKTRLSSEIESHWSVRFAYIQPEKRENVWKLSLSLVLDVFLPLFSLALCEHGEKNYRLIPCEKCTALSYALSPYNITSATG